MLSSAAAGIAAVHCVLVVLVVTGSVCAIFGLLRRRPVLSAVLMVLLLSLILSDLLTGGCLLTTWEVELRERAAPGSAYRGSFLDHYFGFVPPIVHARLGPVLVVAGFLAPPFWWALDRMVRSRAGKRTHLLGPAERPDQAACD